MSKKEQDKLVEWIEDCKCFHVRIKAWKNLKQKNVVVFFEENNVDRSSKDEAERDAAILYTILWCNLSGDTYHRLHEFMNSGHPIKAQIQDILKKNNIEDDFFLK